MYPSHYNVSDGAMCIWVIITFSIDQCVSGSLQNFRRISTYLGPCHASYSPVCIVAIMALNIDQYVFGSLLHFYSMKTYLRYYSCKYFSLLYFENFWLSFLCSFCIFAILHENIYQPLINSHLSIFFLDKFLLGL